jgi:hypothetical protein
MTTPAIRKAVLAKFCAPEWATFLEVHNGTGSTQRRSADAIAMNLFPSRGLRLHGFEFKASRSDWMRELKDPAKSVPIQRYCDHWWIVALPDIVRADELPPNWGLYVLKGSGLHAIVKAPQLERDPIDPPFLAALLRRAHEFAGRELNEEMKKHTAEAEARMEARLEERVQWRTRELKQYKEALDAFEAAAGDLGRRQSRRRRPDDRQAGHHRQLSHRPVHRRQRPPLRRSRGDRAGRGGRPAGG